MGSIIDEILLVATVHILFNAIRERKKERPRATTVFAVSLHVMSQLWIRRRPSHRLAANKYHVDFRFSNALWTARRRDWMSSSWASYMDCSCSSSTMSALSMAWSESSNGHCPRRISETRLWESLCSHPSSSPRYPYRDLSFTL